MSFPTATPAPAVETVIAPTRGWRFLDTRELWAYRDLLGLLVWRDFATRYKQTVLGPLWFVVQPLLMTLVFILFGKVARIDLGQTPPVLFYLCGQLPWNYFAQTFQSTSVTFTNNSGLFGKVYFPRLIVPLAAVVSNLLSMAIQLVTFGIFFAVLKCGAHGANFGLTSGIILLPLALLQVAALSLGVGLWVTALTAKFRDFSILATFAIQLWLYATPVIYPLSQVPVKWHWLVALNPMTLSEEFFRHALLGTDVPSPLLMAASLAATGLVLAGGLLVFQRVEKTFVDVV